MAFCSIYLQIWYENVANIQIKSIFFTYSNKIPINISVKVYLDSLTHLKVIYLKRQQNVIIVLYKLL